MRLRALAVVTCSMTVLIASGTSILGNAMIGSFRETWPLKSKNGQRRCRFKLHCIKSPSARIPCLHVL
ncbi:hypothetical protein ACNJYA_06655 [Bradyrhizobium sp. DASA03068]|uniref:hypothetical protein n=1 Tax=Bradyrhizobium sp. BLXBL-01 TaxID=3395915 RepID=UPI003F6EF3D6